MRTGKNVLFVLWTDKGKNKLKCFPFFLNFPGKKVTFEVGNNDYLLDTQGLPWVSGS